MHINSIPPGMMCKLLDEDIDKRIWYKKDIKDIQP